MTSQLAPCFPIIYVRGYAMTPGEVAEMMPTPYMGFNLGFVGTNHCATRSRRACRAGSPGR